MTAYLITGQAGSGKTTVGQRLRDLGYRGFDTDYRPDLKREAILPLDEPGALPLRTVWSEARYWMVDEPGLVAELATGKPGDPVIVTGCFYNMFGLFPAFTDVFYLSVSAGTMVRNLTDPTRQARNGRVYGADVATQARLARNLPVLEGWMDACGATRIDANRALDEVVADVEDRVYGGAERATQ